MPSLLTLPLPAPAANRRFALSVAETQNWLASLPMDNAPEAGRCVADQIAALNRGSSPLRERLVLTALLRDCAEQLFPALNTQIADAQIPLQSSSRTIARLIDDLLCELAYAYKLAAVELSGCWFRLGVARRLHLPVTRAIQMLARRLALAHRIYAPVPPTVWLDMHQLYRLARLQHIEKLGLSNQNDSPLAIYRDALSLNFAGPHKMMQGELGLAMEFLSGNGELAVFLDSVPQDPVDGLFVIQPGRDAPGIRWSKRHARNPNMSIEADELVLNTSRLADRALQLVDAMPDARSGSTPSGAPPPPDGDLLRKLVRHWTASMGRQYSRLRRNTRVDICIGLHGVWNFLRRSNDSGMVQTSEWMVNNESPGGFALMHVSGPVEPLKVGEVLGVRSRDSDRVHICIVRWVLSDSPEHVELGLEAVSPNAKPVSIARLASSDGYALSTEPGLLLPEIPALNRAASILTMPGSLSSSSEFHFGEPEQRVRATHLVEQTLSLQLFQFSPAN